MLFVTQQFSCMLNPHKNGSLTSNLANLLHMHARIHTISLSLSLSLSLPLFLSLFSSHDDLCTHTMYNTCAASLGMDYGYLSKAVTHSEPGSVVPIVSKASMAYFNK